MTEHNILTFLLIMLGTGILAACIGTYYHIPQLGFGLIGTVFLLLGLYKFFKGA